jgi:sialate O-acetylesterase
MMRSVWNGVSLGAAVAAAVIGLTSGGVAEAAVKVNSLFTPHMVLQRDQPNRVWGWATAGEKVTVTIGNHSESATTGADGKWMVTLKPLPAGGPHTLTIAGENTITIDDVLVGEVWICSGQSNMQWSINQSLDPDLEKLTAKLPNVRLISVPQVGTQEPQDDFKGSWQVCSPEVVGDFSAVGFFFGRQLHAALDVPIGLIDNAWGGSACEAWIRKDLLTADPQYEPLMTRWKQLEDKYDQLVAEWKVAADKAKAEGKNPPPHPDGQMRGNHRPSNIYNGVLKPTIGYGIRGAIWYQGESNAGRAYQYRELFPLMISNWRQEWGQGDFPFYYVQLADFKAEATAPAESDWAELREAQTMTMDKLPNVGEAVIIDIGEGKDIHPMNKQDVGKRLARWALGQTYGMPIAYRSPRYQSMTKNGSTVTLTFSHADGGFRPFDVNEAVGFAVAGEDRKWYPAIGKVVGDKIEVSAEQVADPVAVRYAWADNPVCNVYSKSGLPLTPFRTDDWPGVTINNK